MDDPVTFQVDDLVATIRLNRPARLNALTPDSYACLGELLREATINPAVSVIVLRGEGRAFAAGADIEFYRDLPLDRFQQFIRDSRQVVDSIADCPKPIVAAVHGYAVGGGFELVLACDLVIATESATMGLPEAGLGLLPGGGGTQRLTRLVGRLRANELIMTRRLLTAHEALAWGVVNRVCQEQELDQALSKLTTELLGSAPAARRLAKPLIAAAEDLDLSDGLDLEGELSASLIDTKDGREGIAAFIEKRKPNFGDD